MPHRILIRRRAIEAAPGPADSLLFAGNLRPTALIPKSRPTNHRRNPMQFQKGESGGGPRTPNNKQKGGFGRLDSINGLME
jgi:hypothetical protein